MATGAVSFFNDKLVKRIYVPARENTIVNRLNKTKVVREVRLRFLPLSAACFAELTLCFYCSPSLPAPQVDHEEERIERLRKEGKAKALKANELVRTDATPPSRTRTPPNPSLPSHRSLADSSPPAPSPLSSRKTSA